MPRLLRARGQGQRRNPLFPNSKEVYGDFEDQVWWWKIFYAARENWTVPSEGWEAVDWALFTGNYEANKFLAQRKINFMKAHNIERMIMPDCGGGSYGCRKGMSACVMEDPNNTVGFVYLYDYLIEIIQAGRIKPTRASTRASASPSMIPASTAGSWPGHFGKGYFEEPRWIVRQCVDEFVDMDPNRYLNYSPRRGRRHVAHALREGIGLARPAQVQADQGLRGRRGRGGLLQLPGPDHEAHPQVPRRVYL